LKGRQIAEEIDRVGLRLKLRKAQAEAGDIVLLFADESEALTHPYLARAWAKRGADLRVPAPGQSKKVAMMGALDWLGRRLIVTTSHKPGIQGKPVVIVLDNGPDPHQQGDPCSACCACALAQRGMVAQIRARAQRYRGRLA
jgi:hypothetical protein